jgi:hypothetical protein
MPVESAHVKSERQSQALKEKWTFLERTARFAVSPKASTPGSENPRTHGSSHQGGTSAQHGTSAQQTTAGRSSGKTSARVPLSSLGRHRQASQIAAAVETRCMVPRRRMWPRNERGSHA